MALANSQFVTKNGMVIREIAGELLTAKEGDRILPVSEYAERLHTGRGTIQTALRQLEDSGAVKLYSRGHLGTFIAEINHRRLWEFTASPTLLGVMPLPYTRRYLGLATGLSRAFKEAGIPFNLAHMGGSAKRLEALEIDRYDFAVISALTLELVGKDFPGVEVVMELAPGTLVSDYALLIRHSGAKGIEDGMRVGVDPNSVDQYYLTLSESQGKDVELVELSYLQSLEKLIKGEIDATLWNLDITLPFSQGLSLSLPFLEGFTVLPLSSQGQEAAKKHAQAVIVASRENHLVQRIFRRLIDPRYVETVQKKVVEGQEIAEF
ncbi:MAG: hypothetical protein H5U02_05765 [Clostridia bacterium]|nr:hypothetical protein [Clostridia bacterium]